MKKNIKISPYIYPMPVIMISTYNEDGTVNMMNAAWGTAIDTDMIGICLSSHKTVDNFLRNKSAVIQLATEETINECDYVGIVSGNKIKDKFLKTGLHATKSKFVDAPIIDELPLALECEYVYKDDESGMHYFRIKNVQADESLFDNDGKLDLAKAHAVVYSSLDHKYYSVGKEIGKAFSCGLKLTK